jgi:hypothetical protein
MLEAGISPDSPAWGMRPARRLRFSTANRSGRRKRVGKDNQEGYDAGKEVKGRNIHAFVDSEGLPMRVVVYSAAIQDRDGAGLVLDKIRRRFPWLEFIWADSGDNAGQSLPRRRPGSKPPWPECRCCASRSSSGATT